jgi:chromosome segregation ATPase
MEKNNKIGTSLYNDKKKESKRIIEKKEEKLREIHELLKREIEPQMEKLKKVTIFSIYLKNETIFKGKRHLFALEIW